MSALFGADKMLVFVFICPFHGMGRKEHFLASFRFLSPFLRGVPEAQIGACGWVAHTDLLSFLKKENAWKKGLNPREPMGQFGISVTNSDLPF